MLLYIKVANSVMAFMQEPKLSNMIHCARILFIQGHYILDIGVSALEYKTYNINTGEL